MPKVQCLINLLIEKLYRLTGKSCYFESKYGVKAFNQMIRSEMFEDLDILDQVELIAEDLYIGYDGLKDEYSLLDVAIPDSPHRKLMEVLLNSKNISETEYIHRLRKGYLDSRFALCIRSGVFKTVFDKKKREIETANMSPVKIIVANGKYYVIDGKHIAAICDLLNVKVKCVLINNPFGHKHYIRSLQIMKRSGNYNKNINFLEDLATNEFRNDC